MSRQEGSEEGPWRPSRAGNTSANEMTSQRDNGKVGKQLLVQTAFEIHVAGSRATQRT